MKLDNLKSILLKTGKLELDYRLTVCAVKECYATFCRNCKCSYLESRTCDSCHRTVCYKHLDMVKSRQYDNHTEIYFCVDCGDNKCRL